MKRTPEQIEGELEAIKDWLADLSNDLAEGNDKAAGKEAAQIYFKITALQENLKDRCKSLTN